MYRISYIAILALVLCGCSKAADPNGVSRHEVPVAKAAVTRPAEQIAYTYSFPFELPDKKIADVQARQVALCDRLGSQCRVVSMEQAGGGRDANADMELSVDARAAKPLGQALVDLVKNEGGEVTARTILGENLTKQIIDVAARLHGRQVLADRLLAIVSTHKGSVADLIAAQKALADVQQEIDTARAELNDAQGRVAMSTIRVRYTATVGLGGLASPIVEAFSGFGSIAGMSIAAMVSFLAATLPWLVPIIALIALFRWWKRRRIADD